MLFSRAVLEGIAAGRIDLAFRRRATPPARAGGKQITAIGVVGFRDVDEVAPDRITAAEARRAGFEDRAALLARLKDGDAPVWRIGLRLAGPDPRIALREAIPTKAELGALRERLEQMDASSPRGAWTRQTLGMIAAEPGRRAPDLAAVLGWETVPFKASVRRLKTLGLTESLKVGYRLSPRGRHLLDHLEA